MARIKFKGDPRTLTQDPEITVQGQSFRVGHFVDVQNEELVELLKGNDHFEIEKADDDGDDSTTGTAGSAEADSGRRGRGRRGN